jgi:transglutaminase-like putative cysteine protease
MKRSRGTDGSLLGSLPWTLAALFVSFAPHVPYIPAWISVAFIGCAAWRYFIERRRGVLPHALIRAALALLCFLSVQFTYGSISGVGPGSALLAVMAALKLLETRQRRDQFVLLFLSIFLVMSSLLREQFLWSLPYLVCSMLVIMTAWLHMSASKTQTARQSFVTGGRLFLYAAPVAIAMWVFFPRISTPFWAVPIDTSRAITGLSDTMSPGDISDLSGSDEVAFRVSFDGAIPAPRDRYWRALVITRFNGRTWKGRGPSISGTALDQIEVSGGPVEYEITLEPTRQQWVVALDMPTSWSLKSTFMGPQQQLARSTPIEQRVSYTATSFSDYRVQTQLSETYQTWYTNLPVDSNPRTAELARTMRQAAGTDRAYVDAVLQKFTQEEFFYTLQPPPLGSNPVDRFLFDTRRGFCEHYASAFAVMMRNVGIPTRIVLGYHGGELNPMGGHLIVRQSDAHAWTEIWMEDLGWYRIDPTAAVAPERIEMSASDAALDGIGTSWGFSAPSRLWHQVTLTFDALDAKWNEWILGYGPENQKSFMEWLGMDEPSWRKMMLTLVGLVVAIIMAISVLLMLRYRPPAKDEAAVLYRRFVRKSGLEPHTGETARVFALRVQESGQVPEPAVQAVTEAYLDARYGDGGDAAFDRLKQAVSAIR